VYYWNYRTQSIVLASVHLLLTTLFLSASTRATLSYPLHFHLTPYSAKQD
jgi:hypothetical protein